MSIIKDKTSKILSYGIFELYNITLEEIFLENPPKKEFGDFSFGCFSLSKKIGKNPVLIANELKEKFKNNSHFLDINNIGPYLNLKLSFEFYTEIFLYEIQDIPNIGKNKTIIVDYIGTNVGKPLHIAHMCTPNQGQTTVNLYKLLGYNVIGDSHIGDWGIIFGKLILAYKMWGNENKLRENAIYHLFELYVKITAETEKEPTLEEEIRQEFKLLSQGNKESIKYWTDFTKSSIEAMQLQLDRLNIKPTYDIGESFYEGIGLPKMGDYPDLKYNMSDIVNELLDKKIATKNDDNSVGVIFNDLKISSCILQKRDGAHGYLASDLAGVKYRMQNWYPEKIIYHVDVRQELHLKQVFEISKQAGWLNNTELFHAYNGFVSLKNGAMSTRKGNIIKLDTLLNEAILRAKKIIEDKKTNLQENEINEISEIIGIGAIKYGYLSKSRTTDVIFDWDEFMTFEGNSFPYVAYNYVRGLKILEKSGYNLDFIKNYENKEKFHIPEQINLFKEISNLNEILILVHNNILSHNLVTYVYNLSKNFSNFYSGINILNENKEDKKILNLKLIIKYLETQKIIFDILAIKLPNKM